MALTRRSTKILIFESGRLWNWWLGIVPGPRSWEIRVPGHHEL